MEQNSEFKQLCVWPGCVVGKKKIEDFTSFMKKEFNARVKYAEEVKTNPDPGIDGTGGRNDLLFWVHSEDISLFHTKIKSWYSLVGRYLL